MGLWNTVEFAHVTLRLVPEVFDPIDVSLIVCKEFGMVYPDVMKVRYIQDVVAFPAI